MTVECPLLAAAFSKTCNAWITVWGSKYAAAKTGMGLWQHCCSLGAASLHITILGNTAHAAVVQAHAVRAHMQLQTASQRLDLLGCAPALASNETCVLVTTAISASWLAALQHATTCCCVVVSEQRATWNSAHPLFLVDQHAAARSPVRCCMTHAA